jgi:hypothetical protein
VFEGEEFLVPRRNHGLEIRLLHTQT